MNESVEVKIIPYSPELAPYFKSINEQWIAQMFEIEAGDSKILDDPDRHIIQKGGKIIFASHPALGIVGTCALLDRGVGNFELTKMGVLENARGAKVGKALLVHIIDLAKEMQIANLFLVTSKKCEAAIHLYEKHGFRHDAELLATYGRLYDRCDVAMRYLTKP